MKKQPLFVYAVALILGIFFQEQVGNDVNLVPVFALVGLFALIPFFSRNIILLKLKPIAIGVMAFICGAFLHSLHAKMPVLPMFEKTETLVFKIQKKINSNEKNRRYEVLILQDEDLIPMVLSVPRSHDELQFGNYYRSELYVNRVEEPKNDYQFNYAKYLSRKGIYFQGFLPGEFQMVERRDLSYMEKIKHQREKVLQEIDEADLSARSRELMKGIILADRTEMDAKTVADFRKTGLAHILAISGTHIAIIFGMFYFLFNYLMPSGLRKTAIICSLCAIWIFATFIGFGNSVVRSCIMLSVYFISVLLQRKPDLLHSMAVAAIIILGINTHQLFDVGFQLSFSAVLGIYWLNQPILKLLPKPKGTLQTILINIPSITLAAQISTMPLVLYYFHQYSPISVLANLIVIPLGETIIIFSFVMTILIGIGLTFSWLNWIYDSIISFVLDMIGWLAKTDVFFRNDIPFSLGELLLFAVMVYFLRFLIIRMNLRNILRFSYAFLAFFTLRISLDAYYEQKDEFVIHHQFSEKHYSIKKGKSAVFLVSKNADVDKVSQYVVMPYSTAKRINSYEIKLIPEAVNQIVIGGNIYNLD